MARKPRTEKPAEADEAAQQNKPNSPDNATPKMVTTGHPLGIVVVTH